MCVMVVFVCIGIVCRGKWRMQGKVEDVEEGEGCRIDRLQPLLWESLGGKPMRTV